jgi:hypothetical protein
LGFVFFGFCVFWVLCFLGFVFFGEVLRLSCGSKGRCSKGVVFAGGQGFVGFQAAAHPFHHHVKGSGGDRAG